MRAGILHRDIKPANVLTNAYGWPALTDFGISSNLDGELPVHTVTAPEASATGSGQSAVGMSVPWSPPEMFEDDPKPDTRSDVFSLAATVYTLVAGRTPFEIPGRPNGSLDLMGRIERGAITPIDRADVPRSLTAVLAKGMATRRDDRFPSAVEFARALQRVELELGYAATSIEVPNLATSRESPDDDDAADATRARSVRTVEAQSPAHADRPRSEHAGARRRPHARPHPPADRRATAAAGRCRIGTAARPSTTAPSSARRRRPSRPDSSAGEEPDATVVRPRRAAPDPSARRATRAAAAARRRPRRGRRDRTAALEARHRHRCGGRPGRRRGGRASRSRCRAASRHPRPRPGRPRPARTP